MSAPFNATMPLRIGANGRTAGSGYATHVRDMIETLLFTQQGERVSLRSGAGVAAGMAPRIGCSPADVDAGAPPGSSASAETAIGKATASSSAETAAALTKRANRGGILGMPNITDRYAFSS